MDLEELKLYNLKNINKELIEEEVKRARFRLLGLLGQVYNIIIYIRKSSAYIDTFRKIIRRIIPINNYIR